MTPTATVDSELSSSLRSALSKLAPAEQWGRPPEQFQKLTQALETLPSAAAKKDPVPHLISELANASQDVRNSQARYQAILSEFSRALACSVEPTGTVSFPAVKSPGSASGSKPWAVTGFFHRCYESLGADLIGPIRTNLAEVAAAVNTTFERAQSDNKHVPPEALLAGSGLITLHASLGLPAAKQTAIWNELRSAARSR